MIDIGKLRGTIVEKGFSQRRVAKELGITEKTFYNKMKKGVFSSAEIDAMICLLDMREPMKVFFTNHVSQQETGWL